MLIFIPFFLASTLTLTPPAAAEYTVVVPDSSTLIDAPQTGFSNLARTDPAEQNAVYEIMVASGNSWATSIPDVCRARWHGIECMPDRDNVYHVVALSFGALSEDTAFPTCDAGRPFLSPALLRLPHLRSLFLYRCLARSPQPIPTFLGRLGPALRSLVLRENGHIGSIPSQLANLTNLKVLDLHDNNLRFSIPPSISTLKNLQLLDLSSNQLTGAIPDLILPHLNILDLSHNLLQGQIPITINQCSSLIKMDLSRNQLMGPIPESITILQSLILLDLSHNGLSGPLPSSIGSLNSLRSLILKDNPMSSATIPAKGLAGMKELSTLIMSGMGLEGPIPETISDLPELRVLHLDGNRLNGTIPSSFGKLVKLSELRLNDNQLRGPIPLGREIMWRLGMKLRVYNNSGLCYDGIDALSGIGRCDFDKARAAVAAAKAGSGSVKHVSSSMDSSGADNHGYPPVSVLVLIGWFCLSALVVLQSSW